CVFDQRVVQWPVEERPLQLRDAECVHAQDVRKDGLRGAAALEHELVCAIPASRLRELEAYELAGLVLLHEVADWTVATLGAAVQCGIEPYARPARARPDGI